MRFNLYHVKGVLLVLMISLVFFEPAIVQSQSVIDTLRLVPLPPDSVYVEKANKTIVIGWYPAPDSLSAAVGSKNFTDWYSGNPDVSEVTFVGSYTGNVDRTMIVSKINRSVDTVGYEPSIKMLAEMEDIRDTYRKEFDLGSSAYAPGDTVSLLLIGAKTGDTLDTGLGLVFGDGIIDTTAEGNPASFKVDLQDFEGFHIWRGLSPYPSHMEIIADLSKEDAFRGIKMDSLYFCDWPKYDSRGRKYYEYVDKNVFVGFTYYYIVTTYDRGYFFGHFEHNKEDNYICEDDSLQQFFDPQYGPKSCESVAKRIMMAVDAGTNIKKVYAVPNPYRTGTSAETSPFYHNFPDKAIKFFNVPKECDIKVYTVAGDLVWSTHYSDPSGKNGVVSWNVKNMHGQDVASGVYLFRCESSTGESVYGRIVVIR